MKRNERFIPRFVRRPGPATFLILPLALLVTAGCSSDEPYIDLHPPSIPAGVSSITGDGAVYVRWIPNKESDLAGYRVWWDGDGDEEFDELAKIAPFEDGVYQDNGTATAADDFLEFEDFLGFEFNGTYNSYAISAYDFNGNESGLSWEYVVDVPRPEGFDLRLERRTEFPQSSGYDLSALSSQAQAWDDISTDFWFDFDGRGFRRLYVPRDFVKILDAGFQSYNGFGGLDGVDFAPANGWSAEGVVEAIAGHTYVLRIRNGSKFGPNDFYAKVWVEGFEGGAVLLWWAYQEVPGERQFSQPRPDGDEPREFVSGEEVQR
jgi:hypothetical protein